MLRNAYKLQLKLPASLKGKNIFRDIILCISLATNRDANEISLFFKQKVVRE